MPDHYTIAEEKYREASKLLMQWKIDEAIGLYTLAANRGYPFAHVRLYYIYVGTKRSNKAKAAIHMALAAEKSNFIASEVEYAKQFLDSKSGHALDSKSGHALDSKSGHALDLHLDHAVDLQLDFALCFWSGIGTTRPHTLSAMKIMHTTLESYPRAKENLLLVSLLAKLYYEYNIHLHGMPDAEDYHNMDNYKRASIELHEYAAERGFPLSQYFVASRLRERVKRSRGTAEDRERMYGLFRDAAERGFRQAHEELAEEIGSDNFVEQDNEAAMIREFQVIAGDGGTDAQRRLKNIALGPR